MRRIYRFGIFDFEVESGQLRKHARPLSLERQPARVLAILLARAGDLVSREELRESIWGRETHVDFDRGTGLLSVANSRRSRRPWR